MDFISLWRECEHKMRLRRGVTEEKITEMSEDAETGFLLWEETTVHLQCPTFNLFYKILGVSIQSIVPWMHKYLLLLSDLTGSVL